MLMNFRVDGVQKSRWSVSAAEQGLMLSEWIRKVLDGASGVEHVVPRPGRRKGWNLLPRKEKVAKEVPSEEVEEEFEVVVDLGPWCLRCARDRRVGRLLSPGCEECGKLRARDDG